MLARAKPAFDTNTSFRKPKFCEPGVRLTFVTGTTEADDVIVFQVLFLNAKPCTLCNLLVSTDQVFFGGGVGVVRQHFLICLVQRALEIHHLIAKESVDDGQNKAEVKGHPEASLPPYGRPPFRTA